MKEITALFFGLFIILIAAQSSNIEEWNAYKLKYGKNYDNATEDKKRMEIFFKNKHKVDVHNERHSKGLATYKMGLNKFSDLSSNEFNAQIKGMRTFRLYASMHSPNKSIEHNHHRNRNLVRSQHLPDSIDWRSEGAVNTKGKVQGNCSASWAFAATGAIEGQHFRKTGKLVRLSEQNLLDCATSLFGSCGCDGCDIAGAYLLAEFDGINTEDDYPTKYLAKKGTCQFNFSSSNKIKITFNNEVAAGNEYQLKKAIATAGPIAVRIDGSHDSLKHYSGGIYYEPDCSSNNLNLDVLAVGYGTDKSGEEYYIVQNWLGEDWGEGGFFKLARNRCNHCGVATAATYPYSI